MSTQGKHPILLLLDWDGTLTTTSTLPLIASIATLPNTHPSLKDLSTAYSEDLKRHNDTYLPAKTDRRTVQQELNYLSSFQVVEKTSIERIEASGIFREVGTEDINVAAAETWREGTIALRNGWTRLIESIQQRTNGKVAIISVAWSRRFLSTILYEANRAAGDNRVAVDDIAIKANEIAEDGSGRLDRYLSDRNSGIWTAADKSHVMDQLISSSVLNTAREVAGRPLVVYVGDSPTDLACLLKADIGICIRDEPLTSEQESLREMLEQVGMECLSIKVFSSMVDGLKDEDAETGRNLLWWARDFDEVGEIGVLLGEKLGGSYD